MPMHITRDTDPRDIMIYLASRVDELCDQRLPALERKVGALAEKENKDSDRITTLETRCKVFHNNKSDFKRTESERKDRQYSVLTGCILIVGGGIAVCLKIMGVW